MTKFISIILSLIFFSQPILAKTNLFGSVSKSTFLNFKELEILNEKAEPNQVILDKLDRIFSNPIKGQTHFSSANSLLTDPKTGRKFFRVTHWNLERGYKLDALKEALQNSEAYYAKNNTEKAQIDKELFDAEVKMFNETHIFTINEADLGMKRTNYINTVKKFAEITKSKYHTFIPEFLEIDDKYLKDPEINKSEYRGFHGNAIVSKFPIIKTRVIRLPECYDWYNDELEKLSFLEKMKRKGAKVFFKAPIISELRRGSRNALVARIDLPNSQQDITVVTTHFENRCLPKCRKEQLKILLDELKDVDTPLIFSGDLNNSEVSAEPTSAMNLVGRTLTDWQNLARAIASWFNPFSYIINPAFLVINTARKAHDPTVFGLPLFLRNKTADLFWKLINFEFTDGNMFDFSDAKELCYLGKDGKLGNSNERVAKGFASTFRLIEGNILTHFRFDWLFVKSMRIPGCQDNEDDFEDIKPECKNFIPAFGRNLTELNYSYNKKYSEEVKNNIYRDFSLIKLSDHDPITCKILI
jgi:hypothetical protein